MPNSAPEPDGIRELREHVHEMRRANERHGSVSRSPRRRRLGLILGAGAAAIILVAALVSILGGSKSFALPSRAALAGMSLRERVVAIANSQVGYATTPSNSYCNKFSAYWDAGSPGCPNGARSEQWCADFAAWAWQKAGVRFSYGFGPGEINAGAVSFYEWAVANGLWHPAGDGYVASPGDLAIYGLYLGGASPSASHVAIVTHDSAAQSGPDVINGDGDRTGFSVVETGTDQVRADVSHAANSTLAGYVSVP